jgi:hypothetical protein
MQPGDQARLTQTATVRNRPRLLVGPVFDCCPTVSSYILTVVIPCAHRRGRVRQVSLASVRLDASIELTALPVGP